MELHCSPQSAATFSQSKGNGTNSPELQQFVPAAGE
jgi:hypothetical protein